MKLILTLFVVAILLASAAVTASAADVLELSTLGKKTSVEAVTLPRLSPTMPTISPTSLGGKQDTNVLDLSTLGKKTQTNANASMIKGAAPVTVTPMFSVKNGNVTNQAGSVFTLPQAVAAAPSVYTPPIAIFGGA
ncbi:MAG: hypothetical protein A4E49_02606 [Methanosaeta sp. PtaU1.Bin112]|nr:MAG: hypothetical protein A4E49_02606 [Methanosaeta sp. PtaU1.Bin112]